MKKLLIFIMFFCSKVYALEVEVVKTYLPDVYYNYNLNDIDHWGRVAKVTDEMPIFCINPGVSIKTDEYQIKNDLIRNYLSVEEEEKIKLISYYGYYYPNHQTIKYLLATQKLIWEILGVEDIFYTTKGYGSGKIIDIEDEIEEIENKINDHSLKPSFDDEVINILNKEEIVLEDDNDVLDYYHSENQFVRIDNSNLIFNNEEQLQELTIQKIPLITTKLYYANGSQTLLKPGTEGIEVNSKLFLNQLISEINISYEDDEVGLSNKVGSQYNIYDEDGICLEILFVDENEILHFENLPVGNYTMVEQSSGRGCDRNYTTYEIEISKEKYKYDFILERKVVKRPLIISLNKYNIYNEFTTPVENHKFEIYSDDKLIKTLLTDEEGISSIIMPFGEYIVKSEDIEEFEIEINSSDDDPLRYDFILKEDTKPIVFDIPDTAGNNYFNILNICYILIFAKRKKYEKN